MFKYNPILINHFNLDFVRIKNLDERIEEVDLGVFEKLLEDVKKDFLVDYIDEAFNVYPMSAVLNFISTAANKSYESIMNIRTDQSLEESISYFVPIK